MSIHFAAGSNLYTAKVVNTAQTPPEDLPPAEDWLPRINKFFETKGVPIYSICSGLSDQSRPPEIADHPTCSFGASRSRLCSLFESNQDLTRRSVVSF
jgi:hypothetical protein